MCYNRSAQFRGNTMTPQEREYLRMRYDEDAEHARQHETLRAAATSLFMALIAGLLAFAVEQKTEDTGKQFAAGLLICCASVIGLLFNRVHEARRDLHNQKLKDARHAL